MDIMSHENLSQENVGQIYPLGIDLAEAESIFAREYRNMGLCAFSERIINKS